MFYFPLPEKIIKSKSSYNCNKCKLDQKNTKFKPYIGNNYNGLVIVASNPSKMDDIKKTALTNEEATIVRSSFLKNKINLIHHSAICYSLSCYSHKPTETNFKCCRNTLAENLKELKPKVIITLGEMAFKSVMNIKNKIGATKVRNRIVPNYEFNCLVFPIFDPNDISSYHYKYAIEKDIERICRLWHNKFHKRTYVNKILKERKILENITLHNVKEHEIDDTFKLIHQLKEVALDYETTGLKPFDHWFEITHISFGIKNIAWTFHENLWINDLGIWDKIKQNMVSILTNPNITKIIQNSKFEDLASRYIFNIKKINNMFCTMLSTHVVDERKGCTSLDFQNLMRFGIPPYSETVKSFLEKKNKDDLINNIRKAPYDDMILYAQLDVITLFNNYLVLNNNILDNIYPKARENYNLLLKGHWAFANMTQRGIKIGEEEFDEFEEIIDSKTKEIIRELIKIPELIEYNKLLKENEINKKDGDKEIKELLKASKEKLKRKISFE